MKRTCRSRHTLLICRGFYHRARCLRSTQTPAYLHDLRGNHVTEPSEKHDINVPLLNRNQEHLNIHMTSLKGCGTFAIQSIPAFTRIISEEPLLVMSQGEDLPDLWGRYVALDVHNKAICDSSHRPAAAEKHAPLITKLVKRGYEPQEAGAMALVASIFQANAFNIPGGLSSPMTDGKPIRRALFARVSRINHSCTPNAHANYNPITNRMTVHTLRELDHRSEIEISYFNMLLPLAERQAKAGKWGFVCRCPACNAGPGQMRHEKWKERVREIEKLHLRLIGGEIKEAHEVGRAVQEIDEMRDVVREDFSLTPQLPFAYEYSAVARMMAFEATRDRELLPPIMDLLQRAVAAEIAITGEDSQVTKGRQDKVAAFERVLTDIPAL